MPTHGSLSKAGKTRELTGKPKSRQGMRDKEMKKYAHMKAHKCPRLSARRKYEKRIEMRQKIGQHYKEG